jgi:hypothetical protein
MKTIEATIQVIANGKTTTQHIAGAIPLHSNKIVPFQLDGQSDYEILYKLLINTAAVYVKSQYPDVEFGPQMRDATKIIKELLNKTP